MSSIYVVGGGSRLTHLITALVSDTRVMDIGMVTITVYDRSTPFLNSYAIVCDSLIFILTEWYVRVIKDLTRYAGSIRQIFNRPEQLSGGSKVC